MAVLLLFLVLCSQRCSEEVDARAKVFVLDELPPSLGRWAARNQTEMDVVSSLEALWHYRWDLIRISGSSDGFPPQSEAGVALGGVYHYYKLVTFWE